MAAALQSSVSDGGAAVAEQPLPSCAEPQPDGSLPFSSEASSELDETILLEHEVELLANADAESETTEQLASSAQADVERKLTSEKQDLDKAKVTAKPKPTTTGVWKKVSSKARGPHAKLIRNLHRVAKHALGVLNQHVAGPDKLDKCVKFGEIAMKVHMGIEYKFSCEAIVPKQPARKLWMNVWDHYGQVDVLDVRDTTEADVKETPNTWDKPWYYDETHPAAVK